MDIYVALDSYCDGKLSVFRFQIKIDAYKAFESLSIC